ncbi:unnamed protein product [Ixodes hexagonus]
MSFVTDVADAREVVVEPKSITRLATVSEAPVQEVTFEASVGLRVLLGSRRRFRCALAVACSIGSSLSLLTFTRGFLFSKVGFRRSLRTFTLNFTVPNLRFCCSTFSNRRCFTLS